MPRQFLPQMFGSAVWWAFIIQSLISSANSAHRRHVNADKRQNFLERTLILLDVNTRTPVRVLNDNFLSLQVDPTILKNGWLDFLRFGGKRTDFLQFNNLKNLAKFRGPGPDYYLKNYEDDIVRSDIALDKQKGCKLASHPDIMLELQREKAAQMQQVLLKEQLSDHYSDVTITDHIGFLFPQGTDLYISAAAACIDDMNQGARSLDKLYNFADCAGLHLIFGLNALHRNPDNSWNTSSALSLLKYSAGKKYNISWELGNEPNSYRTMVARSVNSSRLAQDYLLLKKLLQSVRYYNRASLYGPNIGRPRKNAVLLLDGGLLLALVAPGKSSVSQMKCHSIYSVAEQYSTCIIPVLQIKAFTRLFLKYCAFTRFMKNGGSIVDAVTWQHFYVDRRVTKVEDFLKTRLLDTLTDQITKVLKIVKMHDPEKKVWLGGVGPAWAGGLSNLSDTFAAGLLWLNTLGISAMQGIDVVLRHSFFDYGYSRLVDQQFNPLPDYWLSLLFKHLVGPKVLAVQVAGLQRKPRPGKVIRDKLRIYAHCTSFTNLNYVRGSITIYIINLHRSRKKIKLAGTLRNKTVHQYLLQPFGADGLHSKSVQLNGEHLVMLDSDTFPELKPRTLRAGRTILMPPVSIGFYVIKNINAIACRR
ncbi:Inactive heparanase-2 [Bagarius yarrelli]|uniref:Inactive heparanase-2 n=1 Tax=Bagarius yarrelli TaxID=175774 RepID=A0A556TN50_BAGYA|nr:Inactive heparanase-2 [Bagarius yarrelli]